MIVSDVKLIISFYHFIQIVYNIITDVLLLQIFFFIKIYLINTSHEDHTAEKKKVIIVCCG